MSAPSRVSLFVTCLLDGLFPEVAGAVHECLCAAGVEVHFPIDQTCCGQPAYNAGFRDEAKVLARHTIEVLSQAEGDVVIPSGSCAAMVRHGYPELFRGDAVWASRAQALALRTFELSEYLVDNLHIQGFTQAVGAHFAYHASCHLLRDMGVDRQPLHLMEGVNGAVVDRLAHTCCGFGGLFAVDHAELSTEMMLRKLQDIEASGAAWVVGCDASCLMHIEGGLRRIGSEVRCAHLSQVLVGKLRGLR